MKLELISAYERIPELSELVIKIGKYEIENFANYK